jgi:hypothetical protein
MRLSVSVPDTGKSTTARVFFYKRGDIFHLSGEMGSPKKYFQKELRTPAVDKGKMSRQKYYATGLSPQKILHRGKTANSSRVFSEIR